MIFIIIHASFSILDMDDIDEDYIKLFELELPIHACDRLNKVINKTMILSCWLSLFRNAGNSA
jgi:hypothetical protein